MAAFVRNRPSIEILHFANSLRQAAESRHLGAGGMLLHPHLLEFRVAVDVGARRPLPTSAKPRESVLEIEKEGIALLLAIIADVDTDLALLAHDAPHRI